MKALVQVALLAVLVLPASWSRAELVTWILQNALFEDGGVARGSFTLDTTKIDQTNLGNPIASFDITTTPGQADSTGAEYSSSTPGATSHAAYKGKDGPLGGPADVFFGIPDPSDLNTELRHLVLSFDGNLTAAGGVVHLVFVSVEFVNDNGQLLSERGLTGGSLIASVPEPRIDAFLGVALALFFRKRLR
jgi:hypothetical protein